jgi:Fe(3+) dicitrate transport protein
VHVASSLFVVSPALALLNSIAFAQESADQGSAAQADKDIPEILIVAPPLSGQGAIDASPLDNPGSRDVIPAAEVANAGVMNLQEVLRRSPNIVVSEETGSDSLPNIGLRGVTGNDGFFRAVNVSLLSDGIPLVSAPYGQPGASLFPFPLERVYAIDIMKGASSVRYGPNNVSGVINFLSRPIPERPTLEVGFKYDTFRNASNYTAFGATYGRFAYLAEVVYKEGESFRDNGESTIQNYSIKSAYQYTANQRGILQVEYFDDDSNLSDGLSLAAYEADPEQSQSLQNRFEGQQTRYNYKHEAQLGPDTRLDVTNYYYKGKRGFFLGSPIQYGQTANFVQYTPRPSEVWAIQPQLTHAYWIGESTAELVVGVRLHDENITRGVERFFPDDTQTIVSRARFDYTAYTAYVENSFYVGDWSFTPGLRAESIDIEARDVLTPLPPVERDMEEVLPALTVAYLLSDEWSLFANAQATYQPPGANVIELGSDPQEIESQSAWLYELGTRFQSADARTYADVTLYRIDYSNRLEPDPDQFDVFLNSGRSLHEGIELSVDRDLEHEIAKGVGVWASGAYNSSEYTNGDFDGNRLPGTPEWILSWGTRYEHEPSGLSFGLDGFYVDSYFSDRENTVPIAANGTRGEVPSRVVWNAQVAWRHVVSQNFDIKLGLAARNLLDDEYFDTRAGRGIYPGAPTNLGAALTMTWAF